LIFRRDSMRAEGFAGDAHEWIEMRNGVDVGSEEM
jgi:hypothetical protein